MTSYCIVDVLADIVVVDVVVAVDYGNDYGDESNNSVRCLFVCVGWWVCAASRFPKVWW